MTQIPRILYGTAWKKERTRECVLQALRVGYRGIDTACQPKHYDEAAVGSAINTFLKESQQRSGSSSSSSSTSGGHSPKHSETSSFEISAPESSGSIERSIVSREHLFIQTKFTALDAQDPRSVPYDSEAPLEEQVKQSIHQSLENLQLDYLDSVLLHGPMSNDSENGRVWKTLEEFVLNNKIKHIGLSNFYDFEYLEHFYNFISQRIKPTILQNRFYEKTNYDKKIREFCSSHNIVYQSFWTLTANTELISSPIIQQISQEKKKTPAQLFFIYLIHKLKIVPLTGTTNKLHLIQDLETTKDANLKLLEPSEIAVFDQLLKA